MRWRDPGLRHRADSRAVPDSQDPVGIPPARRPRTPTRSYSGLKSGVFPEIGKTPGIAGNFSGRVLRRFSRLDSRTDNGADRELSVHSKQLKIDVGKYAGCYTSAPDVCIERGNWWRTRDQFCN